MARIELSNIGGGGTTLSLTTTGTSGASTLAGSVLNIPIYQGQLTLTTTGTSGAATLSGTTLNIPQYSGGGGTPAGSAGQVQFNSTPAGSFAASSNLAWDNTNVRLNIGAPSSPTGRLNVKGSGTLTTVNTRLTNSGNTELVKVLDNGSTNIGTNFNWDNVNGRLGIGVASPSNSLQVANNGINVEYNSSGSSIFSFPSIQVSNTKTSTSSTDFSFASFNMLGGNSAIRGEFFADGSGFFAGGTPCLYFRNATNSPMLFGTNNTERLRITQNGELIIGTTTANARLQVRGTNTTAAVGTFIVEDGAGTPATIYRIDNDGKVTYRANAISGTTGNQTINTPSGNVNFAIGASALTVTNSLCTTSSLVFATVRTNDATAYIKNVVPAAGSFTINLGAAATAVTSVGFFIIN